MFITEVYCPTCERKWKCEGVNDIRYFFYCEDCIDKNQCPMETLENDRIYQICYNCQDFENIGE